MLITYEVLIDDRIIEIEACDVRIGKKGHLIFENSSEFDGINPPKYELVAIFPKNSIVQVKK